MTEERSRKEVREEEYSRSLTWDESTPPSSGCPDESQDESG